MTLPMPDGLSPRRCQVEAVEALRHAVTSWGWRRPILHLATGAGKGHIIAGLCRLSVDRGRRPLVLVHRRELVEDLAARIGRLDIDVGVVQAQRRETDAPAVVASVQSLASRPESVGQRHLVIVDEAHHATAPTYQAVIAAQPGALVVGMTATPFRSDGEGGTVGLGSAFDGVAYSYPTAEAIRDGVLVPPRGIQIQTYIGIGDVPIGRGGDYDEAALQRAVDVPARNRLIVEKWLEHGEDRQTLAFAVSVEHAQHLADAFTEQGIPAAAVWGDMPRGDRARAVADYHAGRLRVLVSRDLLFEGFDAPSTSCLIRARPTRSAIIARQLVGRGLRTAPGKVDCLVLDFCDDGALLLNPSADLTDPEAVRRVEALADLSPGDFVALRWGDRGVGTVLEAGDRVRVLWADGTDLHPRPELRLATVEEEAEQPIDLRVRGVTEYALQLMPGADPASAVGWYHWRGWWTAGERTRAVAVRQLASGEWKAWAVAGNVAASVAVGRDLIQVQREAAQRARIRPRDWTGDRRPASEAQVAALERRRCRTRVSAGEARCILTACDAVRAIEAAQRERRAGYYDPEPSEAMRRALATIAAGGEVRRKATVRALERRGLLRGGVITDKGRGYVP